MLGLVAELCHYAALAVCGPRCASWPSSLLPIAAYLTGATEMLWKIGTAIGQFGTGFAFSTTKWVGIGVTGLAIALFLAAGGRVRRRASREARKAARGKREDDSVESGVGRR